MRKLTLLAGATLLALFGLSGCNPGEIEDVTTVAPIRAEDPDYGAEAGIQAQIDQAPGNQPQALAKTRYFASRYDAFALLASERAYDQSQTAARLVNEGGFFGTVFVETPAADDVPPVLEPLPAWRLAGVMVGNGVVALLDKGNEVVDIRPGQTIEGTEWVVVSIDTEKAVLERAGNKLPRRFEVPLQQPGAGGGGGTGGGGAQGGGDQGGAPGAGSAGGGMMGPGGGRGSSRADD
jgi:hypothetical protein